MGTVPLGRASEAARLTCWLDELQAADNGGTLLLVGEPGIGKTVLWRWLVGRARAGSVAVLTARAAHRPGPGYEGLADLWADHLELVRDLAEPWRTALTTVLLPRPDEPRPDVQPRASITQAAVQAVRRLADRGPVLLAVDDLPDLDEDSQHVLDAVVRRTADRPVGVVATGLGRPRLVLPDAQALVIGPMADDDIAALVNARLGGPVPRLALRQVLAVARGNPMLAVEVAGLLNSPRPLQEALLDDLPMTLTSRVDDRLSRLPASVLDVLRVVAAHGPALPGLLRQVLGPAADRAVSGAVDAGVIEVSQGRLCVAHPVVGGRALAAAGAGRRRELHRRLAQVCPGLEDRARHLAASVTAPDEEVAGLLADAAQAAWHRGAADTAAQLAEEAVRLTPADSAHRSARVAVAADLLFAAGDAARSEQVVAEGLVDLTPGQSRAELLLRLARCRAMSGGFRAGAALLADALDSPAEPGTTARIRAELAMTVGQYDIEAALPLARSAHAAAREAGDRVLVADTADYLHSLQLLHAEPVSAQLVRRDRMARPGDRDWAPSPRILRRAMGAVLRLKAAGHLAAARDRLQRLAAVIDSEGGEGTLPPVLFHLAELECSAGDLDAAETTLARARAVTGRTASRDLSIQLDYVDGLLAALRGRLGHAAACAERGLAAGIAIDDTRHMLRHARVLALVALARSDHRGAADRLAPVVALAEDRGLREPGFAHADLELVEALAGAARLDEARRTAARLAGRARLPWAAAASRHAEAVVLAAGGDPAGARAKAEAAAQGFLLLGHPVDAGRSLLLAAVLARRDRQRAESRRLLDRAKAVFDGTGVRLWDERLHAEEQRLGMPGPAARLTPTEARIAGAVGHGWSNREVAAHVGVSVKTVEANLSRVYRKLGVHSRAGLAAVLATGPGPPPG